MPPTLGNGKVCYIELPAADIARSAEFYRSVFGWNVRRRGDGALAFDDGVGQVSGTWVEGRPPAGAPGLLVYVMVERIEAAIDAIRACGGEIVQPVGADAPEITARFRDPAGNVLGLYQERTLAAAAAAGPASRAPLPVRIAPSILSGDFARMGEDIARLEAAGADWIHVDVMDGHFVPNLTIGPPVVKALKRVSKAPLDVHIMIAEPDRYAKEFCEAGASYLTFHVEASPDAAATCRRIRDCGTRPGLAIRPSTPLTPAIERAIEHADLVLVMTVEPGFGGQKFMADQMPKLERVFALCGGRAEIEVDGGLDHETVVECARRGANAIVAGSYVFKAKDLAEPIRRLRDGAERARAVRA